MRIPFDLYTTQLFDDVMCHSIVEELRTAPYHPAEVYGKGSAGSIDSRMRKAARIQPRQATIDRVRRALNACKEEVARHFRVALSEYEEPQFLRYQIGDFFVAHQDGNTGMLRLDNEQSRKVSAIVFLNNQSDLLEAGTYSGGSLVFSNWRANEASREYRFAGRAGMLVAFRSETTHEVVPVTGGERYSIASWYR